MLILTKLQTAIERNEGRKMMAKYLATFFWVALLIIAIVIFTIIGCASAPAIPNIASSDENQEERIQKLLIGTWDGYAKDNPWARIDYRDRTLIIYRIRKEQNGWTVNASLNWESLEYIKLNIYKDTITLEMMDRYGGFYVLGPYQNTHLLGKVYYGSKAGIGHDIVLEKISY